MENFYNTTNETGSQLELVKNKEDKVIELFEENRLNMDYNEKLDHLLDFINHRIDILWNDKRWINTLPQLPTFDYYIKNCILDKGGAYDFTERRYNHAIDLGKASRDHNILYKKRSFESKHVMVNIAYSIWMGTAFNFKETFLLV